MEKAFTLLLLLTFAFFGGEGGVVKLRKFGASGGGGGGGGRGPGSGVRGLLFHCGGSSNGARKWTGGGRGVGERNLDESGRGGKKPSLFTRALGPSLAT